MGKSIERDGVFGKYTEHFDDDGNKVGESKIVDGVFGKYVEHTDRHGNKVGESKYREGIFEDYTEHFTRDGKKVGESKDREGIFEDYTEHYSSDGKKLGESKFREGIFQDYTEHTGEPLPFGRREGQAVPPGLSSELGEDDEEEYEPDDPRAHATPGGKGFWFLATPIVLVGVVGWIIELGPFKPGLGSQPAERNIAATSEPVEHENAFPPSSPGGSQTQAAPRPELAPLPPAATPAEAAQSALERYHYVTGLDPNGDNWLALKAAPNASSERLRQLPPDTLLTILSSQEPWQEVRLVSGETGWVHGRYLACCKSEPSDLRAVEAINGQHEVVGVIYPYRPSDAFKVKGSSVRIREKPDTGETTKVLAVVFTGYALDVIGRVRQADGFTWLQVRLPDQIIGFIRSDLVESSASARRQPEGSAPPDSKGPGLLIGAYVRDGVACGQGSNSSLMFWNGQFFSAGRMTNQFPEYVSPGRFSATSENFETRQREVVSISVVGPREYTFSGARYSFCPEADLPEWMRNSTPRQLDSIP